MIPSPFVSLNYNLQPLKQLQPHLVRLLAANGLPEPAISIGRCNAPSSQCRNRFCIVCCALQATAKRRHLKEHLRSAMQANPNAAIWSATPTMLDTAVRHREKAFGFVASVRAFMRSLPTANWFACTEVELSNLGDSSLNTHAHVALVLEPPKDGRRYIRRDDWPELMEQAWQAACADGIDCHPQRLVTPTDALNWASYMTKPANFAEYAIAVGKQLKNPEQFLEEVEALHHVPRYFGPMASRQTSKQPFTPTRNNHVYKESTVLKSLNAHAGIPYSYDSEESLIPIVVTVLKDNDRFIFSVQGPPNLAHSSEGRSDVEGHRSLYEATTKALKSLTPGRTWRLRQEMFAARAEAIRNGEYGEEVPRPKLAITIRTTCSLFTQVGSDFRSNTKATKGSQLVKSMKLMLKQLQRFEVRWELIEDCIASADAQPNCECLKEAATVSQDGQGCIIHSLHAAAEDSLFEPLLGVREAAQLLMLHPNTLLLWARRGRIPCLRLGRRVAFRASTLNGWLSEPYTNSAVRAASTHESEAA
jgi:excisionase family DNA binding protein